MATISASIPLAANMKILVDSASQAEIDDALAAKYATVITTISTRATQGYSTKVFNYSSYSGFDGGALEGGVAANETEFTALMVRYGYVVTKSDANNDSFTTVTVSWA
jgi:hypothetical protein